MDSEIGHEEELIAQFRSLGSIDELLASKIAYAEPP